MLGAFFVFAGIHHFTDPAAFIRIVPPVFPAAAVLVAVSGAVEVLGGVGLMARFTRRWAGWSLVALLIAVFPANVYMLAHNIPLGHTRYPRLLLWLRLPAQAVLIAWVWWSALDRRGSDAAPHAR
jgi:uncharacterized membrane protein